MFEHDYLGGGFTKWACTNALCDKQVGELRKLLAAGRAFFFLISQNIYIKKAQRGATQRTQEVYKGKPKGRKRSEKENQGN
jgi:hypothetical protein